MRLLLDTHVLIWALAAPEQLSSSARAMIEDPAHIPAFSAVAIWEVAIKRGLDRPDFTVDPRLLYRQALDNGYEEIVVTSAHTMSVQSIPHLHRDPFDRLMLAQAMAEGMVLLTADRLILQYGPPARSV